MEPYLEAVVQAARGLELVVYTVATAQSGTAEPGFELELNDGPAMAFRQSLQPTERPAADGRRDILVRTRPQHPASKRPGVGDAVMRACQALVRHRYWRWLSKVDAGRRLLVAGYQSVEMIEQSIAARSGEPPPSGRQARTFQAGVLKEIRTAPSLPA